uniref:Uncharacterized protein n=1 Tax=Lepeophtheirus salmonis TaxID=72036 RepID=A0A0K2TXN7_LEPSM
MERRRVAILELSVRGKTPTKIAKVMNCNRTTVYSVISKGTPEATTRSKSRPLKVGQNGCCRKKVRNVITSTWRTTRGLTPRHTANTWDKVFTGTRATYGDRWWWQQDGASCHTSNFTQEFLQIETPAFFDRNSYPPHSPDCSPLDFAVFGRLKGMLSGVQYKSKD